MAKKFPAHIATQFCGHTSEVALEHYWTVMDSDFNEALATDFGQLPAPEKKDETDDLECA